MGGSRGPAIPDHALCIHKVQYTRLHVTISNYNFCNLRALSPPISTCESTARSGSQEALRRTRIIANLRRKKGKGKETEASPSIVDSDESEFVPATSTDEAAAAFAMKPRNFGHAAGALMRGP